MPSKSEEIVLDAVIAQAQTHSRKKRYADAALLLRSAIKTLGHRASLWGLLGGAEFQQSHFEAAANAYRQAVKLSPRSELASLGLFHSLIELGRHRSAVAELKRFQSVSHSDDYVEIAEKNNIKLPIAA